MNSRFGLILEVPFPPYLVIRGVDEDLVEYLVESWRVGDLPVDDAVGGLVQHPHALGHRVHAPDVSVGPARREGVIVKRGTQ